MKSTEVFQCPSDSTKTPLPPSKAVPISYVFNSSLVMDYPPGNTIVSPRGKISKFQSPAATVMLCEDKNQTADVTNPLENDSLAANGTWHLDYNNVTDGTGNPNRTGYFVTGDLGNRPTGGFNGGNQTDYYTGTGSRSTPAVPGRHTDGSNFLMCDGHVKWLRPGSVSSGFGWNDMNSQDDQQDGDASDFPRSAGTSGKIDGVPIGATFSPY